MSRAANQEPRPTGDKTSDSDPRRTDRHPGPDGHDEWTVEPHLPAVSRTGRRGQEYRDAVTAALSDGRPRSRVEPDKRTAILVARRLHHAAGKLGARLSVRHTPDPNGVKLTFTAKSREDRS